ncbi:hypothetical protein F4820DRAFT_450827, partial [Hypoxylon rubiginosum]
VFNFIGHGIQHLQLQQAFESSKLFFVLPEDERKDVHIGQATGRSFKGWQPPLIQQRQENLPPDTKEKEPPPVRRYELAAHADFSAATIPI